MTIAPIGPIAPVAGPTPVTSVAPTGGAGKAGGIDFASALDNVQQLQNRSDDLAVKAADGSLTDVHDYMIASTEASLATQLTVAVTNKAVAAFNDIMRMQA
jgi:flagellar hook-basal body complex protein FliE